LRLIYTCSLLLALPCIFHVSRHTFATLSITYGAELYTVSKLLGHADIKTTQIYADVINEKKRDAVNSIPSIMD
ncbi:MAG: tyrosine-type recombinase/integrase, partial [Bacteroides ovatus]